MEAAKAARRWGETWQRAWRARDLVSVVALYHPDVRYLSEPFREPFRGTGQLREYLLRVFAEEDGIDAWFGEPVVAGQRASIEWWASLVEEGAEITLVGTSSLRFDDAGLVVEQRDTWNQSDGRLKRPEGWGS